MREATRDAVSHCIYGVDKNPLAVDLCRVALWLESHVGDKPLTYLDHRIRCGDSLVGVFDLAGLKDGIPDKAFEPLEGDDRVTARELARRNRAERSGQTTLLAWNPGNILADLAGKSRTLDAIADDTPETIRRKKQLFEQSHADRAWLRQKEACDLWSAAFFQSLKPNTPAITSGALADHLGGRHHRPASYRSGMGHCLCNQGFFHWPLEFPEIVADGGFDVILSNPPWERVKLQEQEFFAARDSRIANAPTKAARARLIRGAAARLIHSFIANTSKLYGPLPARAVSSRHGGRFPLAGRGDINTYAVFAELCRAAIRPGGRCGIIVPSGIATDDTTKFFFQDLVRSQALASLYDFENRKGIFAAIDSRIKFCLLTLTHTADNATGQAADFVFFALDVDDLRRPEKRFTLTADEIALLNPNTGNCPIFRTQADAELTKAIYRRVPVLWREAADGQPEANPGGWRSVVFTWPRLPPLPHGRGVGGRRLPAEGNILRSPYDRYLPLYEAKMLHQFDHRWATYEERESRRTGDWETEARDVTPQEKSNPAFVVQPRYWVREEVVESTIPKYPEPLAAALQVEHRPSIQYVLTLWAAGFHLHRGDKNQAVKLLHVAISSDLDRAVARALGAGTDEYHANRLAQDFPLTEDDVQAIAEGLDEPESLARDLVERFSPKWFLGWRDICRSTDERTLIASAVPRVAVGT